MLIVALVPLVLGVLVGVGGVLGWRGSLSRDRSAGVRTAATLSSDEAFRVGNKVASYPTMAGGILGILAGIAALAMPSTLGTITAAILGTVALFALLIAGAILGNQAAMAVPEPAEPAGCSGCACGAGGCLGARV